MTEYELEAICERLPDCGCDCMRCQAFAAFQRTELGMDECGEVDEEDDPYADDHERPDY